MQEAADAITMRISFRFAWSVMGIITRNILTGLITVIPVLLTFYLLYWAIAGTERWLGEMLASVLPEGMQLPTGVGVVLALGVLFIIGMLMHTYVVQMLFSRIERLLYRIPLVKLIYPALRDFMDYFSPMKKKTYQQVVCVRFGEDMQAIGLVTRDDLRVIAAPFGGEDNVLVYFPMSYMVGGYALSVPRARVEPLDIGMEEAMRFMLTAGLTGLTEPPTPEPEPADDVQDEKSAVARISRK